MAYYVIVKMDQEGGLCKDKVDIYLDDYDTLVHESGTRIEQVKK
jgi:hypothetical protein